MVIKLIKINYKLIRITSLVVTNEAFVDKELGAKKVSRDQTNHICTWIHVLNLTDNAQVFYFEGRKKKVDCLLVRKTSKSSVRE